jgi:hypothetical protein
MLLIMIIIMLSLLLLVPAFAAKTDVTALRNCGIPEETLHNFRTVYQYYRTYAETYATRRAKCVDLPCSWLSVCLWCSRAICIHC